MIRRIGRNDPRLTKLRIKQQKSTFDIHKDEYETYTGNNYLKVGESISENTQIKELSINLNCNVSEMADGLRLNTSINVLRLEGGVGHCQTTGCNHTGNCCPDAEIFQGIRQLMEVYKKKNSLATLSFRDTTVPFICVSLRFLTNLEQIDIVDCNIADDQLLPMVEAIKGHHLLKKLNLCGNRIGSAGCEALGALLEHPDCGIQTLNLMRNQVGRYGCYHIANGLLNNSSLECLDLVGNNPLNEQLVHRIDERTIDLSFGTLLSDLVYCQLTRKKVNPPEIWCPTLKYYANHTLERLWVDCEKSEYLCDALKMNSCSNKSHVAMRKILKCDNNIVVEPLFGWDESGEWSLKSLPHLLAWFEVAEAAVEYNMSDYDSDGDSDSSVEDEGEEVYDIERKKLSSIFDYAKAMPLLFVPPSHYKALERKRKR